jgi:Rrf2 family protein
MAALALFPGTLVATSSVAERTKVPSNYLAKVLQQLAAAGLIEGRRGVGGGYKLAKPASQINMLEIIRSVGRLQRITSCPLGLANHGPNLCPLHRRMDEAAGMLIDRFSGVTLADLIAEGKFAFLSDRVGKDTRVAAEPDSKRGRGGMCMNLYATG